MTPATPVSRDFGPAQGSGPVYPVGASTALSFLYPVRPSQASWYPSPWSGNKVLWVARPRYRGPVLIRGRRLDGPQELRFGDGHLPDRELRLARADAWTENWRGRQWPSYTRLRAPGCYAWQVDGRGFSRVIVFRAVRSG